jgi:hypothetical protein
MDCPPTGQNPSDEERKFSGGPCHCLQTLKSTARTLGPEALLLVTERCSKSVASHELEHEDIVQMIMDLDPARFKGSEWCRAKPKSPWYRCDAYVVEFKGVNEDNGYEFSVDYYLKLHLKTTRAGNPILIFSLHL